VQMIIRAINVCNVHTRRDNSEFETRDLDRERVLAFLELVFEIK
jgi:hypothetical protein